MAEFTSTYPEKFITLYHYEHSLYPSTQTIPCRSYEEFRDCADRIKGDKNFKWALCLDRETGLRIGDLITPHQEPPIEEHKPTFFWPD